MTFVPVYILVLGFTIVVDYIAGIYLEQVVNKQAKKLLLLLSLVSNIGVLVFFKYFNFLNHAFDNILQLSSNHTPFPYLNILLPIGLSFHTFQAMSYTIEVYRGNHKAERHFGIYALYVMFYPQLVAGPIERPQNILWQFHKNHEFDFEGLKSGLMQMAFGLLKKVVIANRISDIVDKVYADPNKHNGKTFFIVSILYSFQIYCDFSGYTDIGIGAARTMGYKLVDNFNAPYFSKSFSEFWSKWHMSLSTWFRDYLYIPLGGNRVKISRRYLNLMIVFLISGLWHGANWTFLIWGGLHGIFLIFENLKKDLFKRCNYNPANNTIVNILKIAGVFLLISLAWVFFRSPDLNTAHIIFQKLFSASILSPFDFNIVNNAALIFTFLLIILLMFKEYYFITIPTTNTKKFFLKIIGILLISYVFGIFNNKQFIYFQF